MNEPERTEWQIRCAFNGFCKRILKNESINAHKEIRKRQAHEINFSDLTPKEENQLYTCEDFFAEDKEEQTILLIYKAIPTHCIIIKILSRLYWRPIIRQCTWT